MDWSIFWEAFGAIGTTIGSLVTAIAVIVAVVQYKQPLLKKIRVKFNLSISNLDDEVKAYYQVTVINRGIRPCSIASLWIKGRSDNLYLNPAQVRGVGHVDLPIVLQQEESISIFFEKEKLQGQIKELYHLKKWIPKGRNLKIYVHDSADDEYFIKTKIVISKFVKK